MPGRRAKRSSHWTTGLTVVHLGLTIALGMWVAKIPIPAWFPLWTFVGSIVFGVGCTVLTVWVIVWVLDWMSNESA